MPPQATLTRPRALGVHHLKFAVSSLPISLAWYTRVLGAVRIPSLDHLRHDGTRFAVVCHMPEWSNLLVELRENATRARVDRAWDPVTLAVNRRQDLLVWSAWLDACGTVHSPVLTGLRGWLMVLEVSRNLCTSYR
jgi:hypothetical protein